MDYEPAFFCPKNLEIMKFKSAPILLLCLALANPLAAAEGLLSLEPETFLKWSSYSMERLADGRVKLVLTLESSDGLLENLGGFYRLTRPRRWDESAAPGEGETHALDWERSADGLKLVILSEEYERATVFARAEIEGRPHYAQTAFNLYGRSRAGARSEPLSPYPPQAPDWPEFSISSEAPLYWPQTGQNFTFKFKGHTVARNLAVWDGSRRVAELEPGEAGFQYRPEHDPGLNRAGNRASKPLVFVAPGADGGSVSFTLFVHRSRRAGWDLPAGLSVFALGASVSAASVGLARRRFRLCA